LASQPDLRSGISITAPLLVTQSLEVVVQPPHLCYRKGTGAPGSCRLQKKSTPFSQYSIFSHGDSNLLNEPRIRRPPQDSCRKTES